MRVFIFLVAFVAALLVGAVVLSSELGGEVVNITTSDDRGVGFETSLWIVEDGGELFLRAGSTESAWYRRLRADPEITLERNGEKRRYRAVPEPQLTPRINALMARDYGIADRVVSLVRDESSSMAIRLEAVD